MLVVRFYVAMTDLVTECTFIPDFAPEFKGPRSGVFIGRFFAGYHEAVTCDDLTNGLHRVLKRAQEGDVHDQVTDWLTA